MLNCNYLVQFFQSRITICICYISLNSCINTVGDTILMVVKPWFSHEVGKDFRKWENGGVLYYHDIGNDAMKT